MADIEIFQSQYTADQIEDEIENGVPYIDSTNKHWMRWDVTNQVYVDTGIGAEGDGDMKAEDYDPLGTVAQAGGIPDYVDEHSVPAGGTTGQALTKRSSTDRDVEWSTIAGNQVAVQSAQPTDSDTVLWINPDGQGSSIDSVPTSGSLNAVQSGGTYTALEGVKTYANTQDGKRTRNNITNNLANLTTAIAEQNLEKYGYAIGDYFVGASGYKYHLADMDCNYGGYNDHAVVGTHHCGVVVDTLSNCQWLSSGSATSYSASTLHSYLTDTALPNIKSDITALFGDWSNHLLTRTELDNSVGGWGTTWSGLANCLICAMSEVQMYGARVFGCDGQQTGTCAKPLELFAKYRWNEIYGNANIWLKSLYSDSSACRASAGGVAGDDALTGSRRASGLILLK